MPTFDVPVASPDWTTVQPARLDRTVYDIASLSRALRSGIARTRMYKASYFAILPAIKTAA